ncbi:Gfo/Idh/MocA family oxidoreductase [Sediminibacterium roseum]|uniref:Gfo/Idh/MocA family oxidoreductase n=1 Tax=Sediminibacterium roseum TaxID=1978412 RepID=A0ABW9ZWF3_9BACT|nr:Gfo/Idh/MocA family oxidoreductase [Sediminibacterium roseum]NCI51483.1 Gfo/Idh/MocA family oxidoreductase [Sediminibacterium roseum]
MKKTRRNFLKNLAQGSAVIAVGGASQVFGAKSYKRIIGANDRIHMAVIGCNGRGEAMAPIFAKQSNTEVNFICDVDEKARTKGINAVTKAGKEMPRGENDFRKILGNKDLDAVYIATPDHWHAPATIICCAAGKHVYVEKPLSHNPREGELAIAAARKYNRVVQMGSQRRSWPLLTEGIKALHEGAIGNIHLVKCWYTNQRKPIGVGKTAPVPAGLDYDLWQGPAPRRPYKDNLIHYNWHWFWHWGTGEALNNGTHEVDVARWGLNADYPLTVTSAGGRYYYNDDWETPDTQMITFTCPKATILWEGKSCSSFKIQNLDRGVLFHGDKGILLTGHNGYTIYDEKGTILKEIKSNAVIDGRNTMSPNEGLDAVHVADFLASIRLDKRPNADVETGYKSTLWVQLGNISQRVGRNLAIDQANGHIKDDKAAMKLWGREYENGWEPKV